MDGCQQPTQPFVSFTAKMELMRVGLEDIQRMDPEGRLGWYAKSVLDKVDEIIE